MLNFLKWFTFTLVIVGALNWGFIGAFNFDLVSFLFGDMTSLTRIVYTLVGLAAIGYLVFSIKDSHECSQNYNY